MVRCDRAISVRDHSPRIGRTPDSRSTIRESRPPSRAGRFERRYTCVGLEFAASLSERVRDWRNVWRRSAVSIPWARLRSPPEVSFPPAPALGGLNMQPERGTRLRLLARVKILLVGGSAVERGEGAERGAIFFEETSRLLYRCFDLRKFCRGRVVRGYSGTRPGGRGRGGRGEAPAISQQRCYALRPHRFARDRGVRRDRNPSFAVEPFFVRRRTSEGKANFQPGLPR